MNWKTIILLIILGIATFYGTIYYLQWRDKALWEKQKQKGQVQVEQQELTEEEKLIQKQIEELAKQSQEAGTQPLSEEETKKQADELEILRKEADIQPLTPEQIKKQMEELDKLRELYK